MTTPLESSAAKICNSHNVMVYGFNSCHYQEVIEGLMTSTLFKNVFDYHLGYKGHDQAFELTPHISQIETGKTKTADPCKAALVNIVLENYKRKKMGKELIPVLFAIDCENNSRPVTAENITTKKDEQNKKVTFKEIRRAYKLCEEFDDPEIRVIAKETFKFVKVKDDLSLELIQAPWEKEGWKDLWGARMKAPKNTSTQKKTSWRKELDRLKAQFDQSPKKSPLKISLKSSSSSSSSSSSASSYSSSSSSPSTLSSPSSTSSSSILPTSPPSTLSSPSSTSSSSILPTSPPSTLSSPSSTSSSPTLPSSPPSSLSSPSSTSSSPTLPSSPPSSTSIPTRPYLDHLLHSPHSRPSLAERDPGPDAPAKYRDLGRAFIRAL